MYENTTPYGPNTNSYENNKDHLSLPNLGCVSYIRNFYELAKTNSIIALAGHDFAIVAVDVNDDIRLRQAIHRVGNRVMLISTGCQCRTSNLASLLRARMYMNECIRNKIMKPHCLAQLFSCILTNAHFGACESSYMMAGLDKNGKGVVYAYDLLGYHEKTPYRAMGAAKVYLQKYLNNMMRCIQNEYDGSYIGGEPLLYYDEALKLVKKAFKSAAACETVYTGKKLIISGITKSGVIEHKMDL